MTKAYLVPRAVLSALAMTVAATLAVPTVALAEPPAQLRTQAPGYYRFALAGMEVTALFDGTVDLAPKLLSGASAKDIDALLARMFVPKGVQTAVNAFLVHTGQNLVLADTGTAKAFGPGLGYMLDNLRAAGYDPAAVDTVLLTHLHPDHVNGLLAADGKPAFPNAVIRVAKAEADYWLSEEVAAKAPADVQPFFAMARTAVAPYMAAGRFKTFLPGEAVLPGVASVPAEGHTPGHAGYLFTAGDQSLLVWGDIVHSHAVQFARPEVAIEFDVDKKRAVATRKRLLADAASRKLWVAGAHLPFPGIGHVRAESKGYAWVPVEYGPVK
ncbi:MAG: MBL fold metallo-hydrolase [Magnetospirillum sp.]|nr:MBL fold metallo-hydrolase [Magnetospirillum sp.]